jgi:hypothetical protein
VLGSKRKCCGSPWPGDPAMEETHSGWLWIGHCEEFFIVRVYWYFYASHLGYNGYFMRLPPKLTENYNGGGLK